MSHILANLVVVNWGVTMNKIKLLMLVLLLAQCSVSQAVPMTYRFDSISDFINPMDAVFRIDVTVNNGSSSTNNQSYLNTDIVGLAFSSGVSSDSLNKIDNFSRFQGSREYITTDSFGVPTLSLAADPFFTPGFQTSAIFARVESDLNFPREDTVLQLGTLSRGGPIPIFAFLDGRFYQKITAVNSTGVNITTASVPEPSTYFLMSLGLIGIAYTNRKTVKQM